MILGILSDSHGQHARTRAAVDLLSRLGAEAFVHCGDVCGDRVIDALAGKRAWFVWGNMDVREPGMVRYAESLNVTPPADVPTSIELDGRAIAVFHGHEPAFGRLARAVERDDEALARAVLDEAKIVLYGHTHRAADHSGAGVRLINPGALHRAATYTVATLDLSNDKLDHWIVRDGADESDEPQRYKLI